LHDCSRFTKSFTKYCFRAIPIIQLKGNITEP
jgi:hypothetical protein